MPGKGPRQAAEKIIKTLNRAGHEALLAGGCVRDILLGTEPKDFDIATDATPDQICAVFPHAQRVGAHFGVVIVRKYGFPVEVATFRTDGSYSDGRHPDRVEFATAEQDALRRDFTINGMFYDTQRRVVIDHVGGQEDLASRRIQAIGNPEARFEEDHLRMLRAVRFAARLGFEIEPETYEAIYNRADKIKRISSERVREELEKILCDQQRVVGFRLLCETGLLPHLWPQARWSTSLVGQSQAALAALPKQVSFELAVVTMLHQHSVQHVRQVCRALRCSNLITGRAGWLRDGLQQLGSGKVKTLADLKLLMAKSAFGDLLQLFRAVLRAGGHDLAPAEHIEQWAQQVAPEDIAPQPLVGGNDLLEMGLTEGPIFKTILDAVYYRQLNLELRDRDQALQLAAQLAAEANTTFRAP